MYDERFIDSMLFSADSRGHNNPTAIRESFDYYLCAIEYRMSKCG